MFYHKIPFCALKNCSKTYWNLPVHKKGWDENHSQRSTWKHELPKCGRVFLNWRFVLGMEAWNYGSLFRRDGSVLLLNKNSENDCISCLSKTGSVYNLLARDFWWLFVLGLEQFDLRKSNLKHKTLWHNNKTAVKIVRKLDFNDKLENAEIDYLTLNWIFWSGVLWKLMNN